MRWTVPVPIPSDLATFKMPTPFASCFRTFRSGMVTCCARVASGQATAAPPKTVMNSRRLRSSILPRCHRHHTPATGCLGLVGLPHLQLADEGLNRLWARPEFTVLRPRITDQPHSAAGCMALEGMVGLRCNQESGDVDNPASSDDCHI